MSNKTKTATKKNPNKKVIVGQIELNYAVKITTQKMRAMDRAIIKAQSKLYDVVKDCVDTLSGFDNGDTLIKKYKRGITGSSRSAVHIMVKVAQTEFIRTHAKELPNSYQTLYECVKLIDQIGEEAFYDLIAEDRITPDTSKAKISELRKSLRPITSETSDENAAVVTALEATNNNVVTSQVEEISNVVIAMSSDERIELASTIADNLDRNELETLIAQLSSRLQKEAA